MCLGDDKARKSLIDYILQNSGIYPALTIALYRRSNTQSKLAIDYPCHLDILIFVRPVLLTVYTYTKQAGILTLN